MSFCYLLAANCYNVKMTVDNLNGVPQVYTAALGDQTTNAYRTKRDEVVPLVSKTTNTILSFMETFFIKSLTTRTFI